MPSLLSPLRDWPLVFLDVETTGASASYGDRVTEIALARFENGVCTKSWSQLLDPQRYISPGITALTGISSLMCAGQPLFKEIVPTLMEQTRGSILVGHNLPFDLSFLRDELARAGKSFNEFLAGTHCVDTVRLARRLLGKRGNALQKLAVRFNIEVKTAHRALADCMTTQAVMNHILEGKGGLNVSLADALTLQGGVLKMTELEPERALPVDLDEALSAKSPVKIIYLDARNARTERIIIPEELRKNAGELILVAHCTLRNDQRMFKVERIVELEKVEGSVGG
jgi:DNA polymerase III epsilon subunit family exonuclease